MNNLKKICNYLTQFYYLRTKSYVCYVKYVMEAQIDKIYYSIRITRKMIIKIAFFLPINYPSGELFNHKNVLPIYKLYIRQILIKYLQMHLLNTTEITDKRTGKFIEPS